MEYKIDQCALFINMWQSLRPLMKKAMGSTDEEVLQNHIKNALDIIRALGMLTRQMVTEEVISTEAATHILHELTDTGDLITLMGTMHLISLALPNEESDDNLLEDSDTDDIEHEMPDEWEDMT